MELKLSEKAQSIKLGKYRHFKGNLYEVLGVAFNSENLEESVVYRALYGEGNLWVRPIDMFLGNVNKDGLSNVKRFEYIGD